MGIGQPEIGFEGVRFPISWAASGLPAELYDVPTPPPNGTVPTAPLLALEFAARIGDEKCSGPFQALVDELLEQHLTHIRTAARFRY
jgi:hypothetical protein